MTKRILCIEDNVDNFLLLERALSVRGYEVLWGVDGQSGLNQAYTEAPDLILLDINLPDIDGYEIARHLRSLDKFRAVPIIALTANALKGDADKARAAGCDGYIAKPFVVRELWDYIAAALAVEQERHVG